jgi:hypothetical protein
MAGVPAHRQRHRERSAEYGLKRGKKMDVSVPTLVKKLVLIK